MRRVTLLAVVAALLAFLVPARALAHSIGLSTGEYVAEDGAVRAKLTFARGEIAALAPALDADRDGHVTAAELSASRSLLVAKVLDRIEVTTAGARCSPSLTDAALTEEDGIIVGGRFECGRAAAAEVDVRVALLEDLPRGHRHVARSLSNGLTHDEVLYAGKESDSFRIAFAAGASASREKRISALSFFVMGIEHILTGYDHLVFVLGLVLARARIRSLLAVITAFTVAHSISLAVAALGVWTPNPRVVEPAIALSIAYVGIENFFVKDASKRWRITFPFGLIHGFGFAGALAEVSLPRADVPIALFSFNLGVEAGQVAALAVVLPILLQLRKKAWFDRHAVRVLSAAIAVLGGVWFVSRALG